MTQRTRNHATQSNHSATRPARRLSIPGTGCGALWLIVALAMFPGRVGAAEEGVRRLQVSPHPFTLESVKLSCEIPLGGATDSGPVEVSHRFRIMSGASECLWDSGWLTAPSRGGGNLRTASQSVSCPLDSARTEGLGEIRIEARGRVGGQELRPVFRSYYRGPDGRFRPWPQDWPVEWPKADSLNVPLDAELARMLAAAPRITVTQKTSVVIVQVAPDRPSSRVSWGRLKARYR